MGPRGAPAHRFPSRFTPPGVSAFRRSALAALALLPGIARGEEAKGEAKGEAWLQALPELAPALRACLSGGAGEGFATAAESRDGDRVLVRVHRGAATEECLAGTSGEVVWRQPLPEARAPDPAAPAFFLERRCVDARRVEAGDGRVLGWLAYPGC